MALLRRQIPLNKRKLNSLLINESDPETSSYELIIGRDLMHKIRVDICFCSAEVRWDNASISMQSVDKTTEEFEQELLFIQDPLTTDAEMIQNIVESKYCPADLNKQDASYSAQVNKKS
jgi:hypothetical protein